MCGIDLCITHDHYRHLSHNNYPADEDYECYIKRRGPDCDQTASFKVGPWNINLMSSVLHLQGDHCTKQPVSSKNFILQWNGEVYDGLLIPQGESDTFHLFRALHEESVESVFTNIRGEFAFTIIDLHKNILFYGRDFFGRRSLVIKCEGNFIRISSVIPRNEHGFEEVPAKGIWMVDLNKNELEPVLFPWSTDKLPKKPAIKISQSVRTPLDLDSLASNTIMVLENSILRRIPRQFISEVAILFSGGIDSVILAAITDRILPIDRPIDLINVAFENQRFLKGKDSDIDPYSSVPDRISGLLALKDLQRISPLRKWKFVSVNVPKQSYEEIRPHVVNLMRPQDTVMDLSISIALWFAARGEGILPDGTSYYSDCKVIFVGMGADEQFGGYSRHRTAFENGGYPSLSEEMQMEIDRISTRNLGRDDRCISDHGKEARFPFLDEDFVSYIGSLPINAKCDFSLPRGKGEKIILRQIAKIIGFSDEVALLPKRAIQFGAKTAKMENSLEVGDDKVL